VRPAATVDLLKLSVDDACIWIAIWSTHDGSADCIFARRLLVWLCRVRDARNCGQHQTDDLRLVLAFVWDECVNLRQIGAAASATGYVTETSELWSQATPKPSRPLHRAGCSSHVHQSGQSCKASRALPAFS